MNTNNSLEIEEQQLEQKNKEMENNIKLFLNKFDNHVKNVYVNIGAKFVIVEFKKKGRIRFFESDIEYLNDLGLKIFSINFQERNIHLHFTKEKV